MRLSILDQVPIVNDATAKEALEATVKLGIKAEKLGFHRIWIAEHHDLKGLTCPNPDTLLTYIGSKTKKIRLGAGAVLLPHYKPYKIAETYNLLATLFPNRIDLGVGRAPGGSAEASIALSGNYLENVRRYPELVSELKNFIHNSFGTDSLYSKIKASPLPEEKPELWMLGTSDKSAKFAIQNKLNYVFGHFMSASDGQEIVKSYRKTFREKYKKEAYVMVAINVIVAETEEEAFELAKLTAAWSVDSIRERLDFIPTPDIFSQLKLTKEEELSLEKNLEKIIYGDKKYVASEIKSLSRLYEVDEFIIVTNTWTYESRLKSFTLLSEAINLHE